MPTLRLVVLTCVLLLAGCVTPPEATTAATADDAAVSLAPAAPQTFEWKGHVLDSRLEGPTHVQPTEQVLFPVFKEGVLFDVKEVPEVLQVHLNWTGSGQFMIMLHSHKAHGSNAYVEHVTNMSAEKPHCLRVPTEDITKGEWQVMIHSRGAQRADFALTVEMVGGAGEYVKGKYHGHWLQDGSFEVDDHEPWPCLDLTAPR